MTKILNLSILCALLVNIVLSQQSSSQTPSSSILMTSLMNKDYSSTTISPPTYDPARIIKCFYTHDCYEKMRTYELDGMDYYCSRRGYCKKYDSYNDY